VAARPAAQRPPRGPGVTGADTRTRVLQAADALIARHGYDGFSIGDLVAASGVSSGSIYHHFGAKDAVLAALLLTAVEQYQEQVLSILDAHADDARGGVHAVVAAHLTWMAEHRREAGLLLTHRDTVAAGSGRDRLRTLNRRFLSRTAAWLKAQADAGKLPAVDVETAHAIVFAPAQEVSKLWLAGRIRTPPTRFATPLSAAAWAGLLATDPSTTGPR
jgi:AcrR family transcriptional regulator